MHAIHLTADLYRCRCERVWLTEAARLQAWCEAAVGAAGLASLGAVFRETHADEDGWSGVSGALLMPGSHLTLHAWPSTQSVTLDVLLSARQPEALGARALVDALVGHFAPEWTEQRSLDRGDDQ